MILKNYLINSQSSTNMTIPILKEKKETIYYQLIQKIEYNVLSNRRDRT